MLVLLRCLAINCILCVSIACATSSSSSQREAPDALNFSIASSSGSVQIERAFPHLSHNFSDAVYLTHSGDSTNRLFVVRQPGIINVFKNETGPNAQDEVYNFLDIQNIVSTEGPEEGLLGLAFDPNYASNRYFYVYYSAANPRRSVVARYRTSLNNQNQADATSAEIILEITQPPTRSNHKGGTILFGPDGYLYIGLGDGGGAGDPDNYGQNLTTMLGKILRIDPRGGTPYAIPTDNPFVGMSGGVRAEIWASGLRNPYRFSFDRVTGDLWLADVGQNAWEEINVIQKGKNYGWSIFEGNHQFKPGSSDGLTFPVFEYNHTVGFSIIGGNLYRGSIEQLRGAYIYADYVTTGKVWVLFTDRENNYQVILNDVINGPTSNITAFGEDESGELYIVTKDQGIYKFTASSGGGTQSIPQKLSETGIFKTPIKSLQVNAGLIPYDVNMPLWSDYSIKKRWLAIPGTTQTIGFADEGSWTFPIGSVLVKHFEMEMIEGDSASRRKLETRVLLRQEHGWKGFTYKWRADESDADLLSTAQSEQLDIQLAGGGHRIQTYTYPSPENCLACHTQAGGTILGVRTHQLNRIYGTENQLSTLSHLGYFDISLASPDSYGHFPSLTDEGASIEERSRAYLDVNCAHCHQPSGTAPVNIDLRYSVALVDMNAIGVDPATENFGIPGAQIIKAGDKESSTLLLRMSTTDTNRMPPVGSTEVHNQAISIIGQWIDSL